MLKDGLEKRYISEHEYSEMNPDEKDVGRFYCNFKVHKEYEHIPPPRPINSGSGSITENISLFVNYHIKDLATKHPTYLQDTPDFLREIEKINSGPMLPENALLVGLDVTALFTNIPHEDGTQSMRESLDERPDQTVPTEFIVELMKLVLEYNLFTFHDAIFKQLIGVAMGTHPAPPFADIFMARNIDIKITEIATECIEFTLAFLKRFLDDIFMIFLGSTKNLHKFFNRINQIHPSIKFTMNHTENIFEAKEDKCSCEPRKSLQFLDTSCTIEKGKIRIDLFRRKKK